MPASRARPGDHPHYRMRPDFAARFRARLPKRDQFRVLFREVKGYSGEVERNWRHLVEFDSVPYIIARGFCEYLQEGLRMEGASLEDVFEVAAPMPEIGAFSDPLNLMQGISEPFTDDDLMYPHNPGRDFADAARMILHSVGHKAAGRGDPMDQASCLRRGEAKMARGLVDLAGWLRSMSRGDGLHRLMMFVVSRGRRIGATVVLPLREGAFRGICRGELRDDELEPADLRVPSRHLFIAGMSNGEDIPGISARDRTVAQSRCLFYQMAYFARGTRPFRPVIGSFASNDHYAEILRRQGFLATGHRLKGTDHPTVLLRRPPERSLESLPSYIPYEVLILLLKVFRIVNREQWLGEDRLSQRLR